jgi:hypothetical protein
MSKAASEDMMSSTKIELLRQVVAIASQIAEESDFYCDPNCGIYECCKDDATSEIIKLTEQIKTLLQPLIDEGGEEVGGV